jgi:hypothetical protein
MSYGPPIANARPPPPGWQPPFSGAPPPVPPGVNPQAWGAGTWHFNSAYQWPTGGSIPPSNAIWAPGFGWQNGMQPGMQAGGQGPGPYNPYRRVPRPPSAEYLATELVDNPLGLSNMIPREELRGEDGAPQTPWIWNPPGLISTEADDGVITADFRDEQGHRIAQEVRGPTPSRQPSSDRITDPSLTYSHPDRRDLTPSRQNSHDRTNGLSIYTQSSHSDTNLPRRSSYDRPSERSPDYPHDLRRDSTPSRQNSHDKPNEPSSAHSSSSPSSLPPLDRPLGRPKDPSSIYYQRYHSPGASDSPPRQSPSRASHTPDRSSQLSQWRDKPDDQSFTAKIDLQPTFSTNIVRIPDHYQSPSRRGSREDESSRNSASPHAHNPPSNPSVSQLTTRLDRLNVSNSSGPVIRHSSLPIYASSSSTNGAPAIVDEPASILSPLMYGATPKPANRPVPRGYSVPEIRGPHLNTIPEASPAMGCVQHPSHHTSPASSQEGRSSTSNPLPPPPVEFSLTSAPPLRVPTPPPGTYSHRVRLGFWNRRGDHVTQDKLYVVYAPPDRADPPELADYPDPEDGYRNHRNEFILFDPGRPELPHSLPRHGRPPFYPYDKYVVYEYKR